MVHEQVMEASDALTPPTRVLLVDDSEAVRSSLRMVLEFNGFVVTGAANVKEALRLISTQTFDVLLSDLHMPNAGDGLTVVSAMRHSHPEALTLIFSGYPGMAEAASAILMQADEILVKPLAVNTLVSRIRGRMRQERAVQPPVESVATILEQRAHATIDQWLLRVDLEPSIASVPMNRETRSEHLPQLFSDLVYRLRHPLPLGTHAKNSPAAALHGVARRQQGYSPAMMVEESRILQVSIFQTLQDHLQQVDFNLLLVGVMAIADEVDSQLAQTMASYACELPMEIAS